MRRILEHGYLPRELPPPFTTSSFAAWIDSNKHVLPAGFEFKLTGKGNRTTKTISHNLARAGTLRRKLGIPNPISYYQLVDVIVKNWKQLAKLARSSNFSLSKPRYSDRSSVRAIAPAHHFRDLPAARATTRAGARFVLQTDINAFYPSVYTHTIPWAIHGKTTAKANKSNKLLGNLLDSLVRSGQDQQTIGVPIGPDTSLFLAEILLSKVDNELCKRLPRLRGYRYVDDYEFAFPKVAEADEALAALQSVLADFELQLNPRKTQIMDLPLPLVAPWAPEIRLYRMRRGPKGQATDLVDLFSKAFEFARLAREEAVIKYTVARLRSERIVQSNWALYENLLLQSAVVEPGTLDAVLVELYRYQQAGYSVDKTRLAKAFFEVVNTHAPLEHGSEVAFVVWGHLLFHIPVDTNAATLLSQMRDPIVALLLLHARDEKLVPPTINLSSWASVMKGEELVSENWIVAYEAFLKGWLPSTNGKDYIASDPCFSAMRADGVSFYDTAASQGFRPLVSIEAPAEYPAIAYGVSSVV